MITPIEIQSKTFKSGGLGYDKKDVDGFFREVLKSYETIYRENMELNDKVAVLTEGIQYYKTIEKTLQKALVLAEKTAEDTKSAAEDKARSIEREARTRSQLIVADAKNELEHIHNQTIQLVQQYEKYKLQFKKLAEAQIELIESEPFNLNITKLESFIPSQDAKDAKTSEQFDQRGQQVQNFNMQTEMTTDTEMSFSQEAAVTKETSPMEEDFQVEFDDSFMDSYQKDTKKNVNHKDLKANDIEKTSKKHKKHDKNKGEFSFFSIEDEED